ncbi:hypothetical protein AALP_AA6G044800 [Arabis alpina]|uniref:Uncharacterized protein n=1 Tax=Arabis alpina TaxID=50452 RepID=A0A087GM31_ARAAL|nr:hypothetical protein AALP_AA6G044800 [Arabis alpina]
MVYGTRHVVLERTVEHKTLKVGSILCVSETNAPYGRVDGYYFGSVTKPDYVVRLDSNLEKPEDGTHISFIEKFSQYIDEEDLVKRFHDPVKHEFDFYDFEEEEQEEEAECKSDTTEISMSSEEENTNSQMTHHVPQLQHQHFRSNQSTQPMRVVQDTFHQPCPYAAAPLIIVPIIVPVQASMMYPQYHQQSGGLGSLVEQNFPMNMQQQPCPSAAPWTDPTSYYYYSQAQDLYLNSQGSNVFGLQQFPNPNQYDQQQMHPQTQPMQSQGFYGGPSSYRGRGGWRGHRAIERGLGRRSQG